MSLGERIKKARELKNISRAELARMSEVPYSTLAEIENNEQRTSTEIVETAVALGVSPIWLATGKGEIRQSPSARSGYAVVSSDDDKSGIPIKFSDVRGSCGGGAINGDEFDRAPLIKEPSWFKRYKIKPKDALAIWADGDSMSEYIVDGDIAIFDTSKRIPKSGCIYLVQHPDGTKIKKQNVPLMGYEENTGTAPFPHLLNITDSYYNYQVILYNDCIHAQNAYICI